MYAMHKSTVAVLLVLVGFLTSYSALAATSSDVNKQMRNAQSLYFKGKIQAADDALKQAEAMAAEILAGPDEGEKTRVKRLDGRLKKLRKDIDKKLQATVGATTQERAEPTADKATTAQAGPSALPSHVTSDLRVVDRYIASAQQSVNKEDIRNAKRSVGNARNKLERTAERKKKYFTQDHPEYKALEVRIQEIETAVASAEKKRADKQAAADAAAAGLKAESDKWVARLKPYVTGRGQPGYDPERYFVASYTAERDEMARRSTIYGMVAKHMNAYRAAGLGEGISDELRLIVREIDHGLKTFQESTTSMAELKLGEAKRQIDYITVWLDKEAKKIGSKDMPASMNRMTFESARRDLDTASNLLGAEEPRVKALEVEYGAALALDARLAQARVARTRMIPDRFKGSELESLKKKATEILVAAKSDIEILRTSVITPDWKEESVVEWTDTTRSTLRHRVTQSVSAQVAGKAKSKTTLYTLHIAKDRRTDGSWGGLYGHVMFKDPILEENVGK